MAAKIGKYAGDKLSYAISCDNDPTTVHFTYLTYHKVEATQLLNGPPCFLSEEIPINPNDFITISGIERSTMGIWDKEKSIFTDPNELHNKKAKKACPKSLVSRQ